MTDKLPTIDEILQRLYQSGREEEWSGHPSSENMTKAEAKHQLEQLMARERRIEYLKGMLNVLNGVRTQHYGYKGEVVINDFVNFHERMRPIGEDPGFSLPIIEAIAYYELELQSKQQEGSSNVPE